MDTSGHRVLVISYLVFRECNLFLSLSEAAMPVLTGRFFAVHRESAADGGRPGHSVPAAAVYAGVLHQTLSRQLAAASVQ